MSISLDKIITAVAAVGSLVAAIVIEYKRDKNRHKDQWQEDIDRRLYNLKRRYCGNDSNRYQQNNWYDNVSPYQQQYQQPQQQYVNPQPQPQMNNYVQPGFNPSPNLNPVMNNIQSQQQPVNQTYHQPSYGYGYNDDMMFNNNNQCNNNTYGECLWENNIMYNSDGNGFSYYNNINSNNLNSPYKYGYNDTPSESMTYNSDGNGFSYYNNNSNYNGYTDNNQFNTGWAEPIQWNINYTGSGSENGIPINMQNFYDSPIILPKMNYGFYNMSHPPPGSNINCA